jgi:PIN domain nuclease of toxin-antitoxin system
VTILLDTHVWWWWITGERRLSAAQRRRLAKVLLWPTAQHTCVGASSRQD